MKIVIIVIPLLLILAVFTFGWYQGQQGKNATQQSEEKALKEDAWVAEVESIANENAEQLEIALAKAEDEAQQRVNAEAAARMAEQKMEKERLEREEKLRQLNERLRQEAEQREEAQEMLLTLKGRLEELRQAQVEAEEKMQVLMETRAAQRNEPEEAGSTDSGSDTGEAYMPTEEERQLMRLLAVLEARRAELKEIADKERQLRMRYEELLLQEKLTQNEIIDKGGEVDEDIRRRIHSMNDRRRTHR